MFHQLSIAGSVSCVVLFLAQAATAADPPPPPPPPPMPGTAADRANDRARDAANTAADKKETVDNRATAAKSGDNENVNGDSLTSTTSRNAPAQRFGMQRQFAFSSDEALTLSSSSTSGVPGSVTTVLLSPAIDYFIIDNLSVGGFVLFNYTSQNDQHASTFGLGPRVGYNFSFSDLLSLWPKVGMSFDNTSTTIGAATTSGTNVALNLFVPLMIHPAPHFFAGFGPFLDTDLSGDAKTTTWGGKLTIGGWVGL